eukprot:scaffold20551_cov60-Cyclotella_meneghiniana.AAC.2
MEMDLSIPDLSGRWICSWACHCRTVHHLLNVTLVLLSCACRVSRDQGLCQAEGLMELVARLECGPGDA